MEVDRRKRKKPWTAKEEELLVEIWAERIHELRGVRKNSHVYEEMKSDLIGQGCNVSAAEVKSKIHNLTTRYRKEKDLIGPSGGSPSTWPLYYSVHNILGSHKISNVHSLIEESINESVVSDVEALLEDSESDFLQNVSFEIEHVQPSRCKEIPSSSSTSAGISTPITSYCVPEKKKKIGYQQELFSRIDKIGESITQQNEVMKQMDDKLYDLEVKKTKLMEKFVTSAEEYKKAFINFLNKE